MAVQVRLGNMKWIGHDEARGLSVHDGHLFVLTHNGHNGEPVAVYTPNAWTSAVIGDQSARVIGESAP